MLVLPETEISFMPQLAWLIDFQASKRERDQEAIPITEIRVGLLMANHTLAKGDQAWDIPDKQKKTWQPRLFDNQL